MVEFEFGFSYDIEETLELTVRKHKRDLKDIESYYESWDEFLDILASTYSDEDPVFILNVETSANIDASIILAVNGYYRQAITLLRCWFENGMYSLYFHDHPVEFDKWGLGSLPPNKMFMLNFGQFRDYIFQFSNFEKFDDFYNKYYKRKKSAFVKPSFKEFIEFLYSELSAHVHGRGFHRSSLAGITFRLGKERHYNKEFFTFWHDLFSVTLQSIVISFLLYNPRLMNNFRKKRKIILDSLHDDYKDILVKEFEVKY